MSQHRLRLFRILVPFIILIFGCTSNPTPPSVRPEEATLTLLGKGSQLAPGSTASFLVQVRDPVQASALADRSVSVSLVNAEGIERPVFTGLTDEAGLAKVEFGVPADLEGSQQTLQILADTAHGPYILNEAVYVGRGFDILISTDKPVYQPGQIIHIRTLALDKLDLRAAQGEAVVVTLADPEGNKILRREAAVSEYGVASVDFPLDTQAPPGDYIISAALGPTTSTHTVEVKAYKLPRFGVTFLPDKTFYLPGDTATGRIEARYFFGKPVAGAQVILRATAQLNGTDINLETSGKTDEEGVFHYALAVPDVFAGQLDNRAAQIDVDIQVIDPANHLETVEEQITVAEKLLLIDAVPESGLLRPGLANIVYLDVTYPDGKAAQATLTLTGDVSETLTTTTDAYGLAAITLTAPSQRYFALIAEAEDVEGNRVTQPLVLGAETRPATQLLLRPDQSEYHVGATMNLDIFVSGALAGAAPVVYLDVAKDGQSFALAPLPVSDGIARAAIEVDGSLLGTLEINAYAVDRSGVVIYDRRLVLVNPAPAQVTVESDAAEYRPGATARLTVQVTQDGTPMDGVLGVSIVDESVFAVAEQPAGFARTYFLLDRTLQETRYQIRDFADLDDDEYSPYDDTPASIRYAATDAPLRAARQTALAGAFARDLAASHEQQLAQDTTSEATSWPLALFWGNRLYMALPLIGLALYNGSRKRRQLLIALTLFSLATFFWAACAGAPAAPAAEMAAPAAEAGRPEVDGAKPPRLRQFFPETLYWQPEVRTDEQGRAVLDVPIADSITTWRVSVLASDKQGNLGSAEMGLRVFQDFFVEPDLPRFLTVGDVVDVPVSVFNYLDEPQDVRLEVAAGTWFEFVDAPEQTLTVSAHEVVAAYLPIRVLSAGQHELTITATGTAESDAVQRSVEVVPDGRPVNVAQSGRVVEQESVTVEIPADLAGPAGVAVKIYPSAVSQVLEGLEGLLATPYGCFEQTTSVTYPNVMILRYLQATGQANPGLALQAEHLINLGYQRLLTFEVKSAYGGFSLYGEPPPDAMLTAYGLQEFADMNTVLFVDPALLGRMVDFLAGKQDRQGFWEPTHYGAPDAATERDNRVTATAYVVWAMADAGYADSRAVRNGVRYLQRELRSEIRRGGTGTGTSPSAGGTAATAPGTPPAQLSTYALALSANALAAAGEDPTPLLEQLLGQGQRDARGLYWDAGRPTFLASWGEAATIETTALVGQALLRTGQHPAVAQEIVESLIARRDPYGAFGTTQATVQTLKALLMASGEEPVTPLQVTISLGEERRETLTVTDDNRDLLQMVRFDALEPGEHTITISTDGDHPVQYQVVASYYTPWTTPVVDSGAPSSMRVEVIYDRTELAVNESVTAMAEVELLDSNGAGTLLVSLGIPPGFTPVTEDLDALVAGRQVERYEVSERAIILYLTNVDAGEVLRFTYRLQARIPVQVQTPASEAYDYYTPERRATDEPQRINVRLNTP
ncbi:MAG: hypothetical protein H3C34_18290 [Caldilineaceae bacterium]|nr:hypothetical protein [Caldilineaceae bacterium]